MAWIFAATVFVSSALLFLVQPMIARLLLPKFGGVPAVWNTCLVFFQTTLLVGYAYAHVLSTRLNRRWQVGVQWVTLLAPLPLLPITVSAFWSPPADISPVVALLQLLAVSVGLPFFALATNAPLLQRWSAATSRPLADPYVLYAASNAGSLAALLCYPFLIEPAIGLKAQSTLWANAYLVLLAMAALCGVLMLRGPAQYVTSTNSTPSRELPTTAAVTMRRRISWLILAAVPSSLLMAVTTYLSTDVSPMPLTWVVPLSLYLLTFILAFARLPDGVRRTAKLALPPAVAVQVFLMIGSRTGPMGLLVPAGMSAVDPPMALVVAFSLLTFFLAALACHAELALDRPSIEALTEFYLWISLGGALGGLFNAIVSPLVFSAIVEYPLALLLACWLSANSHRTAMRLTRVGDVVAPLAVASLSAGLLIGWQGPPVWRYGLPLAACLALIGHPTRYVLSLAAVLIVAGWFNESRSLVIHRERNFYGILRVTRTPSGDGYSLYHGVVKHGAQFHSDDERLRRLPLTYFFPTGPIGQVFGDWVDTNSRRRIAVVGLGVGSLAGYAGPKQHFTFYEIDPAVARLAGDPTYFTYLTDCPARCDIVLGDARLSLAAAPPGEYDLMVLDAFSGDAPPVHLLTREALALYFAKVVPDGLVALNITNNWVDLAPVVARLAASQQPPLVAVVRSEPDRTISAAERRWGKAGSRWAVMARNAENLGLLADDPRWQRLEAPSDNRVWTDDYSDLVSALRWE